jgi:S-adenosylmethionine-diacylglycerol 3-amino-3-carboxypropyl transferase
MTLPLAENPVRAGEARQRLQRAVRQKRLMSREGLSQFVFARLFTRLVYAQIWEDPDVDMRALRIAPGHHVVTIASGGCNALSYLIADPACIEAVDLNPAHVAFNRLKLAAIEHLPDHDHLRRFYGGGDDPANIDAYERWLRPRLDGRTRGYWEARTISGRRRISIFRRKLYRHGALGIFIGWGHRIARMHGVDPTDLLRAHDIEDQRRYFETMLSPLFDKPVVRWMTRRKSSLFGLGIPPQQYDALAGSGDGMTSVLRERVRKLACAFPLSENYFAWQAFGRGYGAVGAPLPPYLREENYEAVKARAARISIGNRSITELLASKPAASVDRFVLLDAQDWMSDAQLNALWREITRTARPGARVIFRTAAADNLLFGRLEPAHLARWRYHEQESRVLHEEDRSSIYGGFHLHSLEE